MPIPPCACKYDKLCDECHYCCCIAAYPYACRRTVLTTASPASRNTCATCAPPGQFEYGDVRHDVRLIADCYRACARDCCEACTLGQRKLNVVPLMCHILCHVPTITEDEEQCPPNCKRKADDAT